MPFHSLNFEVMIVYELIIGLNYNKCRKGYIWLTDGTFIHPSEFKDSGKEAYGYALSNDTVANLKRSESVHSWFGAKFHCEGCNNAGKSGYFPDKDELSDLYGSIMLGNMRIDLKTAGIYEECNYRGEDNYYSQPNWYCIWSRSEHDSRESYTIRYNGTIHYIAKYNNRYVIPFFKF